MKHLSSLRLHDCAVLFAAPDCFPWPATSANLPVTLSGPGCILSSFREGESLPTTYMNISPTNDYFVVNFTDPGATQNDTFSMRSRNTIVDGKGVSIREFILSRGGVQQLDYRNRIEPIPLR